MSKPYRIVTVSNRKPLQEYYCYDEFLRSTATHNVLILGKERNEYTGLSDKPRLLYNQIINGIIEEDYIIFVDSWDLVFADDADIVFDKYRTFNKSVVIGAEKNCFPSFFKKEFDRVMKNTGEYKYLNSGIIIGRKDAILEILEAMDAPNLPRDYHDSVTGKNYHFNDQAYYMDIFLRQPVDIALDWSCYIGQNMQEVREDELDFSEKRIRNKEHNTYPSVFHWNGGSKDKWSREPILKHLGLFDNNYMYERMMENK